MRRTDGTLTVAPVSDVDPATIVVHDASVVDPSAQFALSRLDDPTMAHVPVGVFRSVDRPTYDDLAREQVSLAVEAAGGPATDDDLVALIAGPDTWTVD